MILRDLRAQFRDTIPISDGFLKLMQETFSFYTSLCNDFFSTLGSHVEANTLSNYLQNEIRPRLFDPEHCKNIEKLKKQFLAENIKLEQFIQETNFKQDFLNDLTSLRKVSDAIYELLQTHWEFFKYEKSVANNEAITRFILEIDRIGIRWDSYLEKYLAVSGILKAVSGDTQKEGYTSLSVQYHLPQDADFTIEMSTNFVQFLQLVFEFVLKTHDAPDNSDALVVSSLEVRNPVHCVLLVPDPFIQSFKKFLGYLSVDILKRETLVKFVMEIVRLQEGKEIPKAAIANFQKKIAKQIESLHPEGYLAINEKDAEDSVKLLSSLCNEMDRLKIEYNDLMTASTNRLARNRTKPLSQLSLFAKKLAPIAEEKELKKVEAPPPEKQAVAKPEMESTVKLNVKKKEHIQFLTS
ncbi:hypothetical protein KKA14_02310 [bacterium]|nr:hypothetical protein [bacterium]